MNPLGQAGARLIKTLCQPAMSAPWELRCDLLAWLLAIREDPYRPGTAPVPGMTQPVRVAPVPGHAEVAFAYLVDDDQHVITSLLIEST